MRTKGGMLGATAALACRQQTGKAQAVQAVLFEHKVFLMPSRIAARGQ